MSTRAIVAAALLSILPRVARPAPLTPDPDVPAGIPAAIKDEIRRTYAVLLDGDRGYLASTAGVLTVELTSPRAPRYLGGLALPDSVNDLALVGRHRIVAANGPSGLVLVDASDPARPRKLASLALPGAAMAVTPIEGGVAVAAGTAGLLLVELAGTPPALKLRARLDTPGYARDVIARGELLVLADGDGGVRIYRHAAGAARELASWRGGGHAFQLDLEGKLLAVAEGTAGLALLELSTPGRPRLLGRLRLRDTARGVSLQRLPGRSGLRAAVADGTAGLAIVDLAQPAAPRELGRHKPERSVNRVVLRGELAFVANDYDGLLVLAVPAASGKPSPLGSLPAPRKP